MELTKLLGRNYIDFKLSDQPKDFAQKMTKKDMCARIVKAMNDETQAIMDYKFQCRFPYS